MLCGVRRGARCMQLGAAARRDTKWVEARASARSQYTVGDVLVWCCMLEASASGIIPTTILAHCSG